MTGGLDADLRVRYDQFNLELSLRIAPGEVVALLGPNGAGKSTALRALAGLLRLADGGEIRVGDQVWDRSADGVFVPAHRRSVGVVFQDYLLFPHLSALENVAFGLRARGVPKRRARQEAYRWLQRVGLDSHADVRPRSLSGGQAQRVALARALAVEPDLLLLDEPLAALDADTRMRVRSDLRHHLADFRGCALVVTHDPLDAMLLAGRLVVVEAGRLVQDGDPAEVARRPRTRYVARLVGLNLLHGYADGDVVRLPSGATVTVAGLSRTREPSDLVTESARGAGPARGGGPGDAVPSSDLAVAFRPSAVSLYREPPHGSPRNVWPATVDSVDRFAGTVRVTVSGPVPLTAEVSAAAIADLGLTVGERVYVAVKATEIDVYPA